jgi:DNA polymerase
VGGKFTPELIESWKLGDVTPQNLVNELGQGVIVWAHNAEFEREAINNLTDWGNIEANQLRCTLALAACQSLPLSLAKLGSCLSIERPKDADGKKVMMRMCKPNKEGVHPEHGPEDMRTLVEYCARDVEAEIDIGHSLLPYSPMQLNAYHETVRINARGIPMDRPLITSCLEARENLRLNADKVITDLTGEGIDMIMSPLKLLIWLTKQGIDIKNTQKATINTLLASEDLDPTVRIVLEQRLIVSSASLKKFDVMDGTSASDGRVRGTIQFHAAFTGRWGGRLIQPQNLPRPVIKDLEEERLSILNNPLADVDTLKSLIRHSIRAPEGKEFICADWANIEGRMLAYLSGEEWKLEAFRDFDEGKGHDLYKLAYAKAFKIDPNDVTDDQRAIGKVQELALGYGGGSGAIEVFAPNKFDESEKQNMKKMYRNANKRIEKFWHDLEYTAVKTVKLKSNKVFTLGKLKFKYAFDSLYIMLPSGRCLRYPIAKVVPVMTPWGAEKDVLSYMKNEKGQWLRTETFGGKISENCYCSNTRVLTIEGVKQIQDITSDDLLWDGVEWVGSRGVINKGEQEVGEWLGVKVTSDHQMHDGKSWKPVIDLDEVSTMKCLESARNLAKLKCCQSLKTLEKIVEQNMSVLADGVGRVKLGNLDAPKRLAVLADIKVKELSDGIFMGLQLLNSLTGGDIDIRVSLADVTTRVVQLTETMAVGESGWHKNGCKIGMFSLSTLDPYLISMLKDLTSTELIMTEIMYPIISDLYHVEKIVTTDAQVSAYLSMAMSMLSRTSCRSSHLNGAAITQLLTTGREVDQATKLWKSTGQKENVYDIMDCGPRNRFTIVTDAGLITTHNCTQAACACLMMEALPRFDNVIMTVHDEIVCEIDEGTGDLPSFEKEFSIVPEWAEGLPISASGWIGKCYRK